MPLAGLNVQGAWGFGVLFFGLIVAAYFQIRSESAKAAMQRVGDAKGETEHWRSSFQAEKTRADGLADEIKIQRDAKHAALNELTAERMKTDLTALMQLVADSFATTNRRFETVEKRMDAIVTFQKHQTEAITEATAALHKIVERLNEGGRTA